MKVNTAMGLAGSAPVADLDESVARCGGAVQIPALLVLIVPFGWMVVFLGALFVLCSRDVGEDGGGKVPQRSLKQQVR